MTCPNCNKEAVNKLGEIIGIEYYMCTACGWIWNSKEITEKEQS